MQSCMFVELYVCSVICVLSCMHVELYVYVYNCMCVVMLSCH